MIYDTVKFFPNKLTMPKMSSTDAAIHAEQYLIYQLHGPVPASLLVTLGDSHTVSLRTLAGIFNKATPRKDLQGWYHLNLNSSIKPSWHRIKTQ